MRDRQIGTTHSGTDRPISNVLLPVVLAFILLCVVVWWNEISDWPRSLMGSPGTPFNWQEALAETALILIAAIFVISRLLRDNHARDRAQQSLRSLSSRYQAILAAVPDIIMEVDRAKVYTWANQAGLEFFGEDVLGKDAAGYFEGEQDTYDLVQPLFEGSEDVIYVESWQHRRDGETRLLAWWCRALKDADGNPMGAALCTARDITERLRAQQALQEAHDELERSEEQSKAISKGIPVPTYTWRWVGEHQAPYEDLVLVG
jgi:PAS domain S-box-containing protein